jgi:Flp pilus assembly protein TadD
MSKAADWAAGALALALAFPANAADQPPSPVVATAADQPSSPDYRKGLEAVHAGRLDEGEAIAKRMVDAAPQGAAGRKLLGLVKARKGDLAGAVAEFDKALAIEPQSIEARAERAVAAARLGQAEIARSDLETLRNRAATCGKTCPPELKAAISRIEAALAAARPPAPASDGTRGR